MAYTPKKRDEALREEVRKRFRQEVVDLIKLKEKKEREDSLRSIIERATAELKASFPDSIGQVGSIIDDLDYDVMRARILDEKQRADGRGLKDIRPIESMIGVLPRAHGSAVFTRGQTQSLGVVTLGTGRDSQRLDAIEGESFRRFMLHYNFRPFRSGRRADMAAREGARSATECWPSDRCSTSCPSRSAFRTPSVSFPRYSNQTARLPWPPSVRVRSRSSAPACR